MTKEKFIFNQRALKHFGLTVAWTFCAGLGLFLLWGMRLPGGTSPLFQVCLSIYFLGGGILVVWLNIRRQKQMGACCPKCRARFYRKSADIVIATGKCEHCGELILDDIPTT